MKYPGFLLTLLTITSLLPAQTLSLGSLVHGQSFALELQGANAPADVAFLVGTNGTGPGTCFTPTLCLDLLDPWVLIALQPVDFAGTSLLTGFVPAGFPLIEISLQSVVVSYAGGTITLTKTNTLTRSIETLSAFSDEFDGPSLDTAWRVHESTEMSSPIVSDGVLLLQPVATGATATWFQDEEGPGLLRTVSGDFTVTTLLEVFNPAALSPQNSPPPISYRLAGLVARDPANAPGSHNSVHVALGGGDVLIPLAVEDKSTMNSTSIFTLHPTPLPTAELRLQRIGATFIMSWRPASGGAWNQVATHVRPDLPLTLEVGPIAYSNQAPALINARFHHVTFSP